jgi:hypothetical protein
MFVLGLAVWLVSLPVLATTSVTTQIYDIDYGTSDQDTLVLLNSGQVAKVPAGKSYIINSLSNSKFNQDSFNFILDDDRFIVEAQPITSYLVAPQSQLEGTTEKAIYIPTTIDSMATAKKYFKEARYNPKDSQCFNRAMVWTYEWWRNHSLKSNKLLIFFTRSYIRRYNFEWWFHISPYVHVMDNGKVVERVMDVKYSSGPRSFKEWTDIFVNKDPECPIISNFSEYADNPYTGICYLQRTHMYTYQPADLQMYEAWNFQKDNFIMDEVRGAYLEAFDEVISK